MHIYLDQELQSRGTDGKESKSLSPVHGFCVTSWVEWESKRDLGPGYSHALLFLRADFVGDFKILVKGFTGDIGQY